MATVEERLRTLEAQMRRALAVTQAVQGQPSDATLSLPHNDSWLFEDNVDATHPANMRYVIPDNVTRVVSARLSIHLAPYRTYNNFSATTTGGTSNNHNHGHNHGAHSHTIPIGNAGGTSTIQWSGAGNSLQSSPGIAGNTSAINSTTPTTDATGQSADHTHLISVTSTLGVTEGTTATGVSISFDGVDHTTDLGGPFNTDQIELDVRAFLAITPGIWHTIAMTPTGNGRIEAHLRLGVYVSAGNVF